MRQYRNPACDVIFVMANSYPASNTDILKSTRDVEAKPITDYFGKSLTEYLGNPCVKPGQQKSTLITLETKYASAY